MWHRSLPDDSQNLTFPSGNIVVPLMLVNQSRACLTNNSTLPGLASNVGGVLWTCAIPGRQLHFDIKANDHSEGSFPQVTLPHGVGTADKADFVITSTDGAPKPVGPSVNGRQPFIYEGVQPPSFFRQPLYRVLEDNGALESKDFKRGSAGGSPVYEFQVLYSKGIILRDSTIERLLKGVESTESTEIRIGEVVWWCKWDKTYIEGRVWMEAVNGTLGKLDSAFRMTLHESRLNDQELQKLFAGTNSTDAAKGAITCQKKVGNGGDLVDAPAGRSISNEINKAKVLSETRAVESVVRRHFGRGSIFRRGSPQLQLTEHADGAGQCLCEWVQDMNVRLS